MCKTNSLDFLNELAGFPPNTFENNFAKTSSRLRLARVLNRRQLRLLYTAAFKAALCNIAINGLGGCGGKIKPERESNRTGLELEFMAARDKFFATTGWKALSAIQRDALRNVLLSVYVSENKLAR